MTHQPLIGQDTTNPQVFLREGIDLFREGAGESGAVWKFEPFQIVSLLEMVKFPLSHFTHLYLWLGGTIKSLRDRDDKSLSNEEVESILTQVARIETLGKMCEIDLDYFTGRIIEKINRKDELLTPLHEVLSQLRAGWEKELRARLFMFIPVGDTHFLDQEAMFGLEVAHAIPESEIDATSAGNCYGTGNYTASVFHLMRVAEFGLRRIASKLKVKLTHKGSPITVEYAVWDQIITACNNKITAIRQKPIGKKREEQLILYSDAAQHCLFMKDIWRNNVSHARKPYNQPEALAVFARVKDFMNFLVVNNL